MNRFFLWYNEMSCHGYHSFEHYFFVFLVGGDGFNFLDQPSLRGTLSDAHLDSLLTARAGKRWEFVVLLMEEIQRTS